MVHIKAATLLAGLVLVWGCSPSGPTKHKLVGSVQFNGVTVSEGALVFEDPSTGSAERIELASNGTYSVLLSSGKYRVSVEPLLAEAKAKVEGPPDLQYKKVDNIPEKYRSASTSGLSHDVSGPGEFNVLMKK